MKQFNMLCILFVVMIFLSIVSFSSAGVINLPKTGQTKCYDISGRETNCLNTGQDGESQKGVEWPNPRFNISRDCVTDNLTGLMWTRNANLNNSITEWFNALNYVKSVNNGNGVCGFKDWRLPNINELASLINIGQTNTAEWLNTQGFSNVKKWKF